MATTSAQVQQLYVAYLGRAADKGGLDYWLGELNATPAKITLDQLGANLVSSQAEYKAIYGGLTREETIIKIYNNLFGRAPDAGGQAYWATGGGSTVPVDKLQAAFINGAAPADAKTVANKVLVSEVYTSTAGANANPADAAEILSGVTSDPATIATAVAKLENGSLSGLAVPVGVGLLKADAAAAKAVIDFQDSKIAELVTANKAIVAINDKLTVKGSVAPVADDTKDYSEAENAVSNAINVRKAVSTDATLVLETKITTTGNDLKAARDVFTSKVTNGVTTAKAYEAALAANAGQKTPVPSDVKQAVDAFQATISNASNTAALAAANKAAGTSFTTAQQVHDALNYTAAKAAIPGDPAAIPPVPAVPAVDAAPADPALVAKITAAFSGLEGFTKLADAAAAENAKFITVNAEAKALADLGGSTDASNYVKAVADSALAKTTLENAKAADALVAQTKAIDDAHAALVKASTDAKAPSYAVDVQTTKIGVDDKADLFHFAAGVKATDDFSVTKFAKGDALYFGEGYTFNNGTLAAGDNNKLEYFFVQKGNDVQVVIETKAFGSANLVTDASTGAVTNGVGEDAAAVITLSGVTANQLKVDAGFITFA